MCVCVWVFFRFFLFFLVDYFLLAILYIITLPQIVFFNFPFFFFLLGQLFVCFDFLCTPCSLSVTHYFFFTVRFRPFVAAPVGVLSSIFSFHSVSHSFWPDWANQASSQLIFQHQQIQFMNPPPPYTPSPISHYHCLTITIIISSFYNP